MAWKISVERREGSSSVWKFMNSRFTWVTNRSTGLFWWLEFRCIYSAENTFSSKRESPKIDERRSGRDTLLARRRTIWQIAFKTRFTRTEVPFGRRSLQKHTAARSSVRAPKSLVRALCLAIWPWIFQWAAKQNFIPSTPGRATKISFIHIKHEESCWMHGYFLKRTHSMF